ncbi:hypothetical protein LOD99_12147 [Oopsacas minuta]|uniref:V(D)J recombination-activating protein 1 RNase H domain-containing protein n=1 Tax=Oopsacas minuta TaxID=111878 RepID=A0AAV7JI26_9METZ|nr:hypothetical protein LOD99_12147 [Oopsacas minuta]
MVKTSQCQPDCFSEPEMKQVEMPIIDQYVKLLILKSHIYKLEDSEYVIIADYDHSQGTVVLNKRRIIIETSSNLCANCYSDTCSHYQAFELCSQNDCLQVCEANILEDIICYFPSPNDIFLLTDDTFHNFQLNNDRWLCCPCSSKCKQHSRLHNILENTGSNTQKKFEYNTISTGAIPFNLDESQIAIYNHQLCHGINLPLNMYPEKEFCDYGFKFNEEEKLKLEKVGIVINLENDINEFKDYKAVENKSFNYKGISINIWSTNKIVHSIAMNSSQFTPSLNLPVLGNSVIILYVYSLQFKMQWTLQLLAVFEGQNSLLLNINNAKKRKLIRVGRTNTFHYHIVYQAWNAYLRTVDIDYDSNYICPKCKDHPDVIILDGIAMGTMKSVPEVDAKFDEDQQYPMIPFSDRVFIPDTAIRKQLLKYCSEGLTENTLKDLLNAVNRILTASANEIPSTSNPKKIRISDGLDGSCSHPVYQQATHSNISTKSFILFEFKVISIFDIDFKLIWKNPLPNSPFSIRPVAILALQENEDNIRYLMDTLINKESTKITEKGLELTSGFCEVEIQRSQLDGKMAKIISGAASACCQFCTATFKQIHDPDIVKDGFPINRSITDLKALFDEVNEEEFLSLSSDNRFNVPHRPISDLGIIPIIKWSPTSKRVSDAKTFVTSLIKDNLNIIIDIPSTQGGTTTTGNVVRRCLIRKDDNDQDFLYWFLTVIPSEFKSHIIEIHTCLGAILRVYNSSRRVDTEELALVCSNIYQSILCAFPWANVSPTLHKLLAHAPEIISTFNDGHGLEKLSEEGLEASNKYIRRYRDRLARKFSFEENLKDVFVRLISHSDPMLLMNRKFSIPRPPSSQ